MITIGTVVFGATLLALIVIGGIIATSICLGRNGLRRCDSRRLSEETRLIQELHNQLSRMEARIEALETIIIEDQGKASNEK